MDKNEIDLLVAEDRKRRAARRRERYDPTTGIGSFGKRVKVKTPVADLPEALVPKEMTADEAYASAENDAVSWKRLRCRHDFEYWAVTCAVIKDKQSCLDKPFVLNRPQRRVLGILESDRIAGKPIRVIMLKARQWGGSTLVQMYMAWIQSCHRTNWHSLICAHVKDTSATIRGMYTKLLANYPPELWEGSEEPKFVPFERSMNVRTIAGRGCRVTLGSSENPDSIRGADYAMAHLSETAFWASTPTRSPKSVVQAVSGAIGLLPYSLIVVESTARGTGDYFHAEWTRCKSGQGDKHAVFVPWYEIDFYRLEASDPAAVLSTMNEAEERLWKAGCTSDQINWYRHKRLEFDSEEAFCAEFPSDDVEAFSSSAYNVFSASKIEALRSQCVIEPETGELDSRGSAFIPDKGGCLKIWEKPAERTRYVTAVDVGGRSRGSDWSVIAVLEGDSPQPRVVAQWRGHVDHDILARKSMALARYYNNSLLVIESNTYETADFGSSSDSNLFILSRLAEEYPNVYRRQCFDSATGRQTSRVGFHTNRSTKTMLIDGLIEAVRECSYIERDPEACNELMVYEQLPGGSFAARAGNHDDILMTRAIALHVIRSGELPPKLPPDYRHYYGN